MADISKIKLPSGTQYNIKDEILTSIILGTATRTKNTDQDKTHSSRIAALQSQIGSLIAGGITYKKVSTLPAAGENTQGNIYFVPASSAGTNNIYNEWLTIDNGASANPRYTWQQIGSTQIDLSNYAQKSDSVSVPSNTSQSSASGISIADHTFTNGAASVTAEDMVIDVKLTSSGTKVNNFVQYVTDANATSSSVTFSGSSEVYSMTSAGSVSPGTASVPTTPSSIDATKFNGGSYSHTGFSGGAYTQGTDTFTNGTLAALSTTVNNQVLTIGWTAPTASTFTQGTDSFTAASYGTDSFTAASLGSGFYTAGTKGSANVPTEVTLPSRSSAIKALTTSTTATAAAQSITCSKAYMGTNITLGNVDMTGTVSGTISAHSITDNGHTHSVPATTGTID